MDENTSEACNGVSSRSRVRKAPAASVLGEMLRLCRGSFCTELAVPCYSVWSSRALRRALSKSVCDRDAAVRLLAELRDVWTDSTAFESALQPFTTSDPSAVETDDTLARALLCHPDLQAAVGEMLLVALERELDAGMEKPLIILSQLKWLECVAEGWTPAARVLNLLPRMRGDLLAGALGLLPELLQVDAASARWELERSEPERGDEGTIPALSPSLRGERATPVLSPPPRSSPPPATLSDALDALEHLLAAEPSHFRLVAESLSDLVPESDRQLADRASALLLRALPGAPADDLGAGLTALLLGPRTGGADPAREVLRLCQGIVARGPAEAAATLGALRHALRWSRRPLEAAVAHLGATLGWPRGKSQGQESDPPPGALELGLATLLLDSADEKVRKALGATLRGALAGEEGARAAASWFEAALGGGGNASPSSLPESAVADAAQLLALLLPAPAGEALAEALARAAAGDPRGRVAAALGRELKALACGGSAAQALGALRALQAVLGAAPETVLSAGEGVGWLAGLAGINWGTSASSPAQQQLCAASVGALADAVCASAALEAGGEREADIQASQNASPFTLHASVLASLEVCLRDPGLSGGSAPQALAAVSLCAELCARCCAPGAPAETLTPALATLLKRVLAAATERPLAAAALSAALARGPVPAAAAQALTEAVLEVLETQCVTDFEGGRIGGGETAGEEAGRESAGDRALPSEAWWNLDGEESPAIIQILPHAGQGAPPGIKKPSPLPCFPALLELAAALLQSQQGELGAIDALLGAPLHLCGWRQLDGAGASQVRPRVLVAAAHALQWCRGLLNAFAGWPRALAAQPELARKVVARVDACMALERALAAALAAQPLAAAEVERALTRLDVGGSRARPATCGRSGRPPGGGRAREESEGEEEAAVSPRSEAGGGARSAARDARLPGAVKAKLRALSLPAASATLSLLISEGSVEASAGQQQQARVVFVLEELSVTLAEQARRGSGSVSPDSLAALAEPVRSLLKTAASGISLGQASCEARSGADGSSASSLLGGDPTRQPSPAFAPAPGPEARRRLVAAALDLAQAVVQAATSSANHAALIRALGGSQSLCDGVDALSAWEREAGADSSEGVAGEPAASAPRATSLGQIRVRVAGVRVMNALSGADPELQAGFGERISKAAWEVLACQMTLPDAWPAHASLISELLELHFRHHPRPVEALSAVAREHFPEVTSAAVGPRALESVEGLPSLSGITLPVWYKCTLEALQRHWTTCAAQALALAPAASAEDACASLIACSSVFSALMALVKLQDSRRQVHALALRLGPRFVDAFQRLLPWWRAGRLQELPGSFERLVRDLQRGTRVLQVLCAQGKAARAAGLAARVPTCKRSVERFAFKVRLLLTQAQRVGAFWMGALKHRDLLGNEVLSQAYADGEQGDDHEEPGEEEPGDEAVQLVEEEEDDEEDQRGEGDSETEDE